MKEINDLDVFIRKKLSQQTHSFHEAYWEQAEALIEADKRNRKQRRLLFIWWGMGIMLVMFLTAGLAFRYVKAPIHNTAQDATQSQSLTVIEPSTSAWSSKPSTHQARIDAPTQQEASTDGTQRISLGAPSEAQYQVESTPYSTEDQAQYDATIIIPTRGTMTALEGPIDPSATASPSLSDYDVWLAAGSYRVPLNQLGQKAQVDWLSWQEKRHGLAIEAGWQWNPSWSSDADSKGSLHPVLGVSYLYWLRPALRFQAGLRYSGRGSLGTSYRFTDIERSFGQVRTDSTFQPRQLHQIEVPLRLEGRIAGRHYAAIGVNGTWLMETTGVIEVSQQQTILPEPVIQSRTQTRGLGHGFRRGDLQLVAGYGYYVGEGMMIRAEGTYGLQDMTDQTFFENNRFDRQIGLRLLFSYQIR